MVAEIIEMQVVLPSGVCFIRFRDTVPCVSPMLPQQVQMEVEIKMSLPVGNLQWD